MLKPAQINSFKSRGYCVMEGVMSATQLADARAAADALVQAAQQLYDVATIRTEVYP